MFGAPGGGGEGVEHLLGLRCIAAGEGPVKDGESRVWRDVSWCDVLPLALLYSSLLIERLAPSNSATCQSRPCGERRGRLRWNRGIKEVLEVPVHPSK